LGDDSVDAIRAKLDRWLLTWTPGTASRRAVAFA
jgi:hypothetical protein